MACWFQSMWVSKGESVDTCLYLGFDLLRDNLPIQTAQSTSQDNQSYNQARTINHTIKPGNQTYNQGQKVVTLSPPTSEAGVRFLARPQVGKLVVACCWSVVYILT